MYFVATTLETANMYFVTTTLLQHLRETNLKQQNHLCSNKNTPLFLLLLFSSKLCKIEYFSLQKKKGKKKERKKRCKFCRCCHCKTPLFAPAKELAAKCVFEISVRRCKRALCHASILQIQLSIVAQTNNDGYGARTIAACTTHTKTVLFLMY